MFWATEEPEPELKPGRAPKKRAPKKIDVIQRGLGVVRRRVLMNRFLRNFFLDAFIALSLFWGFYLTHRLISLEVATLPIFATVVGLAVVLSVWRSFAWGRSTNLQAAVLVDEEMGLKERVSTAVYLREQPRRGDGEGWNELVERDGSKALEESKLREQFPIRLPRMARWLALPAAVCLATYFLPQQDLLGFHQDRESDKTMDEQVGKNKEETIEKLDDLVKENGEESLDSEMQKLLDEMKQDLKKKEGAANSNTAAQTPEGAEANKKQALVRFAKAEDRVRNKLNEKKYKDLDQFLAKNKLRSIDPNALTRALQDALKKGDLSKAAGEMDKLRQRLQKLAQAQKNGKLSKKDLDQLKRLAAELQQLAKNSPSLSQLSAALGQLSSGLSAGNAGMSLQGMQKLNTNLGDLAQLMKQMKFLDKSLQLVKLQKQSLSKLHKCPNCGKPRQGPMRPGGT